MAKTQNWARIEDGVVREVIDFDPAGKFHPSINWVKCPATVDQHFTYDGSTFTAPSPPPQTTAEMLAPHGTLNGLSADEVAALEELANIINTNPEALQAATGEQQ